MRSFSNHAVSLMFNAVFPRADDQGQQSISERLRVIFTRLN